VLGEVELADEAAGFAAPADRDADGPTPAELAGDFDPETGEDF